MADSKRQHLMTDGLVLREYQTIAESDRFVAILTRERGPCAGIGRGARKMNSRAGAATQQLCYARFSLIPGRDKYIVEDAQPQEVFFPLRQQVERLALGQYFCELALHLTPTDAPAPEHLRLLLQCPAFSRRGQPAAGADQGGGGGASAVPGGVYAGSGRLQPLRLHRGSGLVVFAAGWYADLRRLRTRK